MFRKSAWRDLFLIFLVTGLVGAQEHAFSRSTVFRLFAEVGNFDNARERCREERNNTVDFTLARIDSREIFDFIVDKFDLPNLVLPLISDITGTGRSSIWIGMKRSPESNEETRSTEDFSFVEPIPFVPPRDFFEEAGVLPWAFTQPNNARGIEHCVSWETQNENGDDLPLRWYDDICGNSMSAFLCRGEVLPTRAPTREPTTPKPTEAPSKSPSLSPTEAPSDSSSSSPTIAASPDEQDNLRSTIFLSLAGVSGSLMLLSLVILVRKKRDLKSVQQALHDREKLSELALADEKEGAMY